MSAPISITRWRHRGICTNLYLIFNLLQGLKSFPGPYRSLRPKPLIHFSPHSSKPRFPYLVFGLPGTILPFQPCANSLQYSLESLQVGFIYQQPNKKARIGPVLHQEFNHLCFSQNVSLLE
ncbi:hypothetical protein, unlikely [Trypanosoma congolense IL3000]|uniref:Uncharacterized protein n=1 Tax=Trypanosoma congolense (strain IL3000) TaxID=1068625 RepID=F9W6J9_TRYCI|nr:hypothetical protein, unlikely [Trypanosoma congolense IL3000]